MSFRSIFEKNAVVVRFLPVMQSLYELSDSQWAEIKTILEPKGRKRKTNLQLAVSGIVYLLQNGYKWASLLPFYGDYKVVWYYYNKWMLLGALEQPLYELNKKLRRKEGRPPEPSLLIVDSQFVKTVAGTSEAKGYWKI